MFDNEYLEVCVHPNGQFTMGTVGGNPNTETDDHKLLLFGHPTAYTSETVIRVDGVDYRFHSENVRSSHSDESGEVVRSISGVEIRQILTLVENPMTGRKDIVQVRYECRNTTSEAKEVGVRVMLDTMLGDNDGAPFRVGEEQFTREREYIGSDIPSYWLCFDNFDNPAVTSVGTLYTRASERPDKVQFASWGEIMNSAWDYQTQNRYMYDTAVAVYFDPAILAPDATRSVTTYYGISETTSVPLPGELSMRIVKPAALNDDGNGNYENSPFDVTAYVKNDGETPLTNVRLNLDLMGSDALELVDGAEKVIANLGPGAEDAAQWTVRAKPQSGETTVRYRVTGDYDGQSEQSVVELETRLAALPISHNVTFQAEGAAPIVVQVSHNGSLAESDIPAVPEKPGYVGAWNAGDLAKLTNVTQDIAVKASYVPQVRSVALDETNLALTIGQAETAQLTATVLPEEAPDKSVNWVSYNESVATVDENGVVTAVAVGTATIEAKANADETKSAACAVTVEAVLTGIEVTPPSSWKMTQGDPLDITGLSVKAVFSDGSSQEVTDYTLTGYDPNPEELGAVTYDDDGQPVGGADYKDETLTIRYKDYEETCTVRVVKLPATLQAISISRTPTKRLNYVQGEKLNLDGMQVNFIYSDGTTSPRPVVFANNEIPEGFLVTGYDPSRVGNQAITLSYGGKSQQFYIRVLASKNAAPVTNVLQPRVSVESEQGGKLVSLTQPNGSGYDIYYTTDGTTPTANSTKYTAPFRVAETTTVKAVTISNGVQSPLTSMQVYLPQVEPPVVANLHHRNNQGLNRSMTELEPGTLVSFISNTAGASIYYWIDGKLGSAEDSKYGTSVYMKPEYADENGNVVLYAYATKDGYTNSTTTRMSYHLNVPETSTDTATISVGRVTSRSGENIAPTLSINATGAGKIRNFSVKIQYDSGVMAFQSVSPFVNGTEVFSSNVVHGRDGVVTLQYNGVDPLDLGEVCALNFRVQDSSENDSYDLKIDQTAVSVNLTSNSAMVYDFVNGLISIVGAHNSQLAAATSIVDADGNVISSADALRAGDDFMANVTIALPEGTADATGVASLSSGEDNSLKTLNVFLVIYDANHTMVSLENWDIDVTDPANLQSVRRIRIPRRVQGGSVRFMIMSEELTPSVASNSL